MDRIKVTAGGAKATFTSEGNNFEFSTMLTTIKSISVIIVTTVKHFIDIFKNGITNGNTGRSESMKMVIKNIFNYVHSKIIS